MRKGWCEFIRAGDTEIDRPLHIASLEIPQNKTDQTAPRRQIALLLKPGEIVQVDNQPIL